MSKLLQTATAMAMVLTCTYLPSDMPSYVAKERDYNAGFRKQNKRRAWKKRRSGNRK